MPTDDKRIEKARAKAEKLLRRLPGVISVGIGGKFRKNFSTGELALVVSVEKKKPLADVPAAERIPAEIDGFPTDVEERGPVRSLQEVKVTPVEDDDTKYRKPSLQPGSTISISPKFPDPSNQSIKQFVQSGTLGCFAKTTDQDPPQIVALTNHHVVCVDEEENVGKNFHDPDIPATIPDPNANFPAKKAIGRKIGQPSSTEPSWCSPCCNDFIGQTFDAILSDHVDGAIVALNPGLLYNNVVPSIGNIVGTQVIASGDPRIVPGTLVVQKRGKRTFFTRGTVRQVNVPVSFSSLTIPLQNFELTIEIIPCAPFQYFAGEGDSGSVVVGVDGNVVGLLFSGTHPLLPTPNIQPVANASRIDLVLKELKIMIPSASNAPLTVPDTNHPATSPRPGDKVSASELHPATTAFEQQYADLIATSAGRECFSTFERHQEELLRLVRKNRRIAAGWKRWKGWALIREASACAQNRGRRMPNVIGERPLEDVVERLHAVIGRYATPELKKDLDRYAPALARLGGVTFEELMVQLEAGSWPSL